MQTVIENLSFIKSSFVLQENRSETPQVLLKELISMLKKNGPADRIQDVNRLLAFIRSRLKSKEDQA